MRREKKVCLRDRDLTLMFHLSDYGIITNENVKEMYGSKYYYKNRLASLAKGEMIERQYGKVVLGTKGKKYLNDTGIGYRNTNRNESYKKRMERISDIACKFRNCTWFFRPSWECSVNTYTKRGNRFVGIATRTHRELLEKDEDFYKREGYIVYFLYKEITLRELRYIDKEIQRNNEHFRGLIIFTEYNHYLRKPRFVNCRFKDFYTIYYDKKCWEIIRLIKNENYMEKKLYEMYGYNLVSLCGKSFFDEYYIEKNNEKKYIYPMAFANFYIMDYLNSMKKSFMHSDQNMTVVCTDYCFEDVRKYLDDRIEVRSIHCFENYE